MDRGTCNFTILWCENNKLNVNLNISESLQHVITSFTVDLILSWLCNTLDGGQTCVFGGVRVFTGLQM